MTSASAKPLLGEGDTADLAAQAAQLEQLLPELARRLFTIDPEHPLGELPISQLRVCALLQAGERTMSQVGDEIGVSVSAVTQIADRLEAAGLVERVAQCAGGDRRTKRLRLTDHGEALMRSRRTQRVNRVEQALAQLPPEARSQVLDAVRQLLATSQALESSRESPA